MSEEAKKYRKSKGVSSSVYDMRNIKSPRLDVDELMQSYSDHRSREVLEKAEKEIEKEFPTSPNALIISTNDHNKSGAEWLLNYLKEKLPNNIQER